MWSLLGSRADDLSNPLLFFILGRSTQPPIDLGSTCRRLGIWKKFLRRDSDCSSEDVDHVGKNSLTATLDVRDGSSTE